MVRTASNSAPGLIYHPEREKRAGEGEETACRVTTGEHHQSESKKKKVSLSLLVASPAALFLLSRCCLHCPASLPLRTQEPCFRPRRQSRGHQGLARPDPGVSCPCLLRSGPCACVAFLPRLSLQPPAWPLRLQKHVAPWLRRPLATTRAWPALAVVACGCQRRPDRLNQWPPQPPNRAAPHQCLPLRLRHLATLALNDCPRPSPRLPPPLNLDHPRFSHPHFTRPVCNTRNGKCGQELWAAGDWRRQRRTGLRPSRRRVWRQGPSFTLRLVAS